MSNRRFQEMVGFNENELQNKKITDFTYFEDSKVIFQIMEILQLKTSLKFKYGWKNLSRTKSNSLGGTSIVIKVSKRTA